MTDELTSQVAALATAVGQIGDLVASARRLAERQPKLGTAPPALHLATRLQDAAGQTGLSGEVSAADAELDSFHRALRTTTDRYRDGDKGAAVTLTKSGEGVNDSR
nr:hypothetical protein [Kibdelosporangium sp. MJ126-NF4]